MTLSERERSVLDQIHHWSDQLCEYEQTDFQMTYDKVMEQTFQLVPEEIRSEFFSKIDNWLFHLHAVIQGTQLQMDARERIITSARAFQEVDQLTDLKKLSLDQLTYLAEHQIAKHRVYSFAQGGLVGTGGLLLVGTDILTMTTINLRAVQLIAMTYGYETSTPYEMMLSLKVFHSATLPKNVKHQGWIELIEELNDLTQENLYLYEGNDQLINETWMGQPLKQILKGFVIFMFRKKLIQGLPLIGMTIGASMNYQFTRQITEFTHKFYQYRYLKEKAGSDL
ncbi:EcsC family protein [Litchfieldia salsa]|uniref:EcsC protein family protein n=1 Tax=Litchfieldia salsa TaxID=930152 RepID=A0A1H0P4R4_9BACI|nr:EcsC family protein [Litchfieldia salsa]SDO99799.1 EcsC protein family protein [Litchfieldia salsa]